MNVRISLAMAALVASASAFLLMDCSAEGKDGRRTNLVAEVVDSVATAVAAGFSQASRAWPAVAKDSLLQPDSGNFVFQVADMIIVEPHFYAVFDGGVVIYDFSRKSQTIVPINERLTSIATHEGKLYIGGRRLYVMQDSTLEPADVEVADTITALYSHGHHLMIGTGRGLYSKSIFGNELLFDDVHVTAMVADAGGLWVGTGGQGLYCWDGEEFRRRFLLRDTSMFDTVNALAFKRHHVYVGTTNGLHIFDGGRWNNLSIRDGLPSDNVRTVDASEWTVYVGTDRGVVSYFAGELTPVKKLEDRAVNVLRRRGRQLLVGTDYDGILVKSREVLKILIPPVADSGSDVLSLTR